MLRLVVASALAAVALGACPNLCSNHGTCGMGDICTCYNNWMGPDCSLRVCPSGNSWALDSATPHAYEECSGAGICDRVSGECKCFGGFEGYSCQRRSCPNDCSGNGVCRLLVDVPTAVAYSASAWDNSQLMACVCDVGYFGSDCSQRRCATGDDPITMCPTTSSVGQVQQVTFTLGSKMTHTTGANSPANSYNEGMDLFGVDAEANHGFDAIREQASISQALVGATDAYGQEFLAPTAAKAIFSADRFAAGGADAGAASLKVALENIRNYRIDTVNVDAVNIGGTSAACSSADVSTTCPYGGMSPYVLEKRYLVTFVPNTADSANFGAQNPLVCLSGYSCSVSGCAPIVNMPFLYRYATTDSTTVGQAFSSVAGTTFSFFTGAANSDAAFAAVSFLRLHPMSSPQMPPGMDVDTGVTEASAGRYDVRVVVATQDPVDGGDSSVDVYWTKVIFGHVNISTDGFDYGSSGETGVWSSTNTQFAPSLLGFTYRGFVPSELYASVPDAPGIVVEFPARNLVVVDGNYRFFEIIVKLPSCDVTPLVTGSEFVGAANNVLVPVDSRIENVECANRGQCNRATGLCECFSGFYGISCSQMTTQM